ncbi:outer membrane beta-barrel protein [Taibaiella lutea]|nr:outer membrane beta-barrel protein [Taibaiella lutea]
MNRLLYLFFILFCVFTTTNVVAQNNPQQVTTKNFSITGVLADTINLTNTGYASVSALNASDSVLQTFTRTDENGRFELKVNAAGKYLLLISHPSFATYIDIIDVDKANADVGTIMMTSKKQMLNEVIITDARAIVIKGDTIEYNADSFKTRAFDNVDELLKKLPGIEIGKDGKIKAYGQEVKKMTVDGEEFFSDDPAIVSKTLRASAIDKVQVFDKKSDQATFSGVDDGERIKTINLQLKENAKKGYFGKAQLGGGLPGYFENEAMINAFKGKQKIAAYGIMSNTNTNGLGWEEQSKYGGGGGTFTEDDDGNFYSTYTTDDEDWGGEYRGTGLPKAWVGGALYNNKWLNDSLIFNSNYKFSKKMNEGLENVTSQYILPDTQYFNKQQSSNRNIAVRHNVRVSTEYWIDTSSSLKLDLSGGYNNTQSLNRNVSESMDAGGTLINNNTTAQEKDGSKKLLNADLLYKKRFKKKGRTFTADFTGSWTDSRNNGTLQSAYNLFSIDSSYSINQRKSDTNTNITGKLSLTYTEPLTDKLNLQFNYNYNLNHNDAANNSYDINQDNGNYTDVFNPFYSSHYLVNVNQHLGGAGLRYNTKKINAGIGVNLSETHFTQEDKLFDTTYHYSYFNVLPKASFRYSKSQNTSISFRYNGKAIQPNLTQLQPLRNNTDPLNITIGNPDLKQAYDHGFNVNYNTYKMLSSQYLYFGSYFHVIQNSISNKQFVDNNGRSVTQFVNVNGNYYGGIWSGGSRKIKDVEVNAGINGDYNHDNNFINGLPNVNNRLSFTPNLGVRYNKDTTLDFDYNFSPGYNLSKSSIRPDITTKYWQFDQTLNFHISLPYKFRFGSEMTLNLRQKLNPAETNNNRFLWNLSLSRFFLKDRSLELKAYVNDLLNQNVGYSRYNTATYVSERTYNTIRRYAMFSIIWNFTKVGGSAPAADNVIEIDN